MIKKFFCDTETTGLDPKIQHVHQIAAIVTDNKLKYIDHCNIRFQPKSFENANPEALAKTHLTLEDLKRRQPYEAGGKAFVAFLDKHCDKFDKNDKMQFLAYNAPFDESFVTPVIDDFDGFFGSYFYRPSLCIQRQAAWLLQDKRDQIARMKLCDMCEYAGIEFNEDEAHDALYDIKKTVELFKEIR